jgi:hypothetical protein
MNQMRRRASRALDRTAVVHVRNLSSSTFVSEHFTPDPLDFKSVLANMDSKTRVASDGTLTVKVCRLCPKGNKEDVGNHWKLTVRPNGSYFCYRCTQGRAHHMQDY